MKELTRIIDTLRQHKEKIRKKYGVKSLGIFGSYVRGEQREDSDLVRDLLTSLNFLNLRNTLKTF